MFHIFRPISLLAFVIGVFILAASAQTTKEQEARRLTGEIVSALESDDPDGALQAIAAYEDLGIQTPGLVLLAKGHAWLLKEDLPRALTAYEIALKASDLTSLDRVKTEEAVRKLKPVIASEQEADAARDAHIDELLTQADLALKERDSASADELEAEARALAGEDRSGFAAVRLRSFSARQQWNDAASALSAYNALGGNRATDPAVQEASLLIEQMLVVGKDLEALLPACAAGDTFACSIIEEPSHQKVYCDYGVAAACVKVLEGEFEFARAPRLTYPARALKEGIEGSCEVTFDLSVEGVPENVISQCTHPVFRRESVRAIKKARAKPLILAGVPHASFGHKRVLHYRFAP